MIRRCHSLLKGLGFSTFLFFSATPSVSMLGKCRISGGWLKDRFGGNGGVVGFAVPTEDAVAANRTHTRVSSPAAGDFS